MKNGERRAGVESGEGRMESEERRTDTTSVLHSSLPAVHSPLFILRSPLSILPSSFRVLSCTKTKLLMKRSIVTVLSFVLALGVSAQALENQDSLKPVAQSFTPSFAVKWSPPSIYFGKISLSGEYNFKKKRSVTFYIGVPVETSSRWNIEDEKRTITMKTFSLMGGYRMYLGKGAMRGLYFEPYLKYLGNKGSFTYVDTESIDSTTYLLSSDLNGVGVGAQLGVQFLIAKRVTLDFFFLGPEANLSRWDIALQDQGNYSWDALDAAEAKDIMDDIVDDLPGMISNHVETSVNASSKTVSAKYDGILPGIRFGISLGVRF
jgi:hypothetical protein